nr:MAG TPA: MAEBL protein [Caudoviricetes sp.]
MKNIAVSFMKANKKRKRAIKKAEQKMEKFNKLKQQHDKYATKLQKEGLVKTQPEKSKSVWDDKRTEVLYKALLYNDKELKKYEVNQLKNNVSDLNNKRKEYKEYYNSLKEMNKNNEYIGVTQIDFASKIVKSKDISKLSTKEQKRALDKIKKQFNGNRYEVIEKDGIVTVEKLFTVKKQTNDVKEENKKVLDQAKKHLDELNKEYKEAKQFKKDVNKTLKNNDELQQKLKEEREAKNIELKESLQRKTTRLLDSLDYEYEIVDENHIKRTREIFDPKKMRNIKTKEIVSLKQLMREKEFVDKYNSEMEAIGWDNHKITYIELNKIMENAKYKNYNQIARPQEYQKKVRTRGINNLLKSLRSSGLANTDFYAFVEQNLNLSNIDDIIKNMNDGEVVDIYKSDQATTANSFKKFIEGFNLDWNSEFRGRTLAEIVEEAEQKI